MEWILFTIGLLIGSILGMMVIGIVSSGKMSDLDNEIITNEDIKISDAFYKNKQEYIIDDEMSDYSTS